MNMQALKFEVDSPVPRYRQVVQKIQQKIESGELESGARLPAEDAIAASLGIHWQTVHRAMRELAREGWIERRPRHGTRVTPFLRNLVLLVPIAGETHGETELWDVVARHFLRRLHRKNMGVQVLHISTDGVILEEHRCLCLAAGRGQD